MLRPLTIEDLEQLAKKIQTTKNRLDKEHKQESDDYKSLVKEYLELIQERDKIANILFPKANIKEI